MKCFKCDKELEDVFENSGERNRQYSGSVEFLGMGAYGSCHDMDKFTLQICDTCIEQHSVEKLDSYFENKGCEFNCRHCNKHLMTAFRHCGKFYCDEDCRDDELIELSLIHI